jgi:peptide chain release factor subunit 1
MAETVSWDGLRELAEFRAEKGCAISLYLDLDPKTTPTAGDAASHVNALLTEGERHAEANNRGLTHDQRIALKEDFSRIRDYFANEFQRDGAHGVALFSAGMDNVWRPRTLIESVPNRVRVGREFHLAPLVPLVGRGEGAIVAFVGRERGELFRLRAGRLDEIVDRTDDVPGRHDQGGWSQARFQRHIEKLVAEHLKEVAEELDRHARRMRAPKVIVVSSEETRAEFEELLSNGTKNALVGWTSAEAHASPQ